MKSILTKFSSKILNQIDLNHLIRISKRNFIVPLYHTISNDELPHIKNLYPIKNVNQFKKDLDFIQNHYQSESVSSLINTFNDSPGKTNSKFHLTFDDGLKEVKNIIAPILLEKGIHATFFLNPDFIDNKNLFYRFKVSLLIESLKINKISNATLIKVCKILKSDSIENAFKRLLLINWNEINVLDEAAEVLKVDFSEYLKNEPFLNSSDVNWLIEKGFTIGSHSLNHPRFTDISLEEQKSQITIGQNMINEKFKISEKLFAFPFSDQGLEKIIFESIFNKDGFNLDLAFGTSGLNERKFPKNIQRIPLEYQNLSAEVIIKSHYMKYILKRKLNLS